MRKLSLLVSAAWLAGCVSVSETMVKPGVYYVDVSSNTSVRTVNRTSLMEKFHAKARELCGPADYDFETADGERVPGVTGYVRCKGAAATEAGPEGTPPASVAADQE